MKHLYEDENKTIHACQMGEIGAWTKTRFAWTRCGIDVPANKSFESVEQVNCPACAAKQQVSE